MIKPELFVRHTLNLTHRQSAGLQIIADAYGMPLTEHVRRAVDLYIAVVRENDSGLGLPVSPPAQAPTADPPKPVEPTPLIPTDLPDPAADKTLILADNPPPDPVPPMADVAPPLPPATADPRPTNPDLRGAARKWGTSIESASPVPTNQG